MIIKPFHFALKYNKKTGTSSDDKSKVWVQLCDNDTEDSDILATGYVDNIWDFDTIDKTLELPVTITKTQYFEHMNGGRSNNQAYPTIQAYWADPEVERRVKQLYADRFSMFGVSGDPSAVDIEYTLTVDNTDNSFTLCDHLWDVKPPAEWYNQIHYATIQQLSVKEHFSSATDAIKHQTATDDLFGERYFPVLKAPKHLEYKMQSICEEFKGYSDVLTDDEYVYIGIRSKRYQLDNIDDIYNAGGVILQNAEWNW